MYSKVLGKFCSLFFVRSPFNIPHTWPRFLAANWGREAQEAHVHSIARFWSIEHNSFNRIPIECIAHTISELWLFDWDNSCNHTPVHQIGYIKKVAQKPRNSAYIDCFPCLEVSYNHGEPKKQKNKFEFLWPKFLIKLCRRTCYRKVAIFGGKFLGVFWKIFRIFLKILATV